MQSIFSLAGYFDLTNNKQYFRLSIGDALRSQSAQLNVRFWHLADLSKRHSYVRFRSDNRCLKCSTRAFPLLTGADIAAASQYLAC
jgi:hypothetical protein